jgi:hypothetical protein
MKTHTRPGLSGKIVAWALCALMALPRFAFAADAPLVNMSVRISVVKDDSFVTGFVIGGSVPRQVLLRAVGPGLAAFGVADANPDPRMQVFRGDGAPYYGNDDWEAQSVRPDAPPVTRQGLIDAMAKAGAFPLAAGSFDSATVITLSPGPYTVKLSGSRGDAGSILFELYLLE